MKSASPGLPTQSHKPRGTDDKVFDAIALIVCLLILLVVVYPLWYVVICSFSDPNAVTGGQVVFWPVGWTLEGYHTILDYNPIWIGYRNTLMYALAGTAFNLVLTLPCAYALARPDFKGRNLFMMLFTFTMFFNGGTIPTYMTMKNLGTLNTIWAMILPGAVNVMNLIIARTYFANSVPYEIQEAAMIDGCSNTKMFLRIVMPLAMPMIAVIMLYYLVTHWNVYFRALLYISDPNKYPLQLYLRNILLFDQMLDMMEGDAEALEAMTRRLQLRASIKYGIVVVSSLPVLILYPLLQKYFAKGVMVGAVKG